MLFPPPPTTEMTRPAILPHTQVVTHTELVIWLRCCDIMASMEQRQDGLPTAAGRPEYSLTISCALRKHIGGVTHPSRRLHVLRRVL